MGRAAPQGIKGSERALWADVSLFERSGRHARVSAELTARRARAVRSMAETLL